MTLSFEVATDRKMNLLIASEREALGRGFAETIRAQGHQAMVQENAAGVADSLGLPGLDAVVLDADLPGVDWDQLRSALVPGRPVLPEPLDAVERRHIAATLRYTNGNRRNAALLLGIARSTLLAKLRKYGLDHD